MLLSVMVWSCVAVASIKAAMDYLRARLRPFQTEATPRLRTRGPKRNSASRPIDIKFQEVSIAHTHVCESAR